jgi:UDP-N-acetylenolpyruvoylglucosamine reductase
MSIIDSLNTSLGQGRIQQHKDISPYFTLKTKTAAEYYFEAESRDDLINAVRVAHELKLPLLLLGGGSNMAIVQDEIKGLVVRNMYQKKEVVQDTPDYVDLFVSSGYPMGRLVKETAEAGYEGLEYHLGLPGTIGGGIYMNSKWTKPVCYVGDVLLNATIIDREGNVKKVERDYFNFAYDYSILQETKEIVLEAVFRLKKKDPEVLKLHSQAALEYRKQTQPFGVATGGCFFQNISEEEKNRLGLETKSAGYLIDQAGLKGTQVGGFVVSDKHANFIINRGGGTPEDLRSILSLIKNKVKEKFGVELKEEVIVI